MATNACTAAKRLIIINSQLLIESEWLERDVAHKECLKPSHFRCCSLCLSVPTGEALKMQGVTATVHFSID